MPLLNVREHNFWGGPTYTRGHGYRQSDNDGSMQHRAFDELGVDAGAATIAHTLDWVTAAGRTVITEQRRIDVSVPAGADAWVLTWFTQLTNVSGAALPIGSPATEGREGAGYAGLFWRGPRSWTGVDEHQRGGIAASAVPSGETQPRAADAVEVVISGAAGSQHRAAFVVSSGNGLGGPAGSTLFYTLYLYERRFQDLRMGYASAMAWMLLLAVGLVTAVLFRTSRSWVFYNDGSNS